MARKLSVEQIIPQHQQILAAKAALFNTVYDVSNFAVKGSDKVSYPTLAAATAEDLDLSLNPTITGEDLNFGKDELIMNRAAARGFEVYDYEEEENYLNGVELGIQTGMDAIARGIDAKIYSDLMTTTNQVEETGDIQADFISAIESLDARNVPSSDRFYACSSGDYAKLLKVRDFVSNDSRGNGDRIGTGIIGELYGVTVVKTNIVSGKSAMYHRGALAIARHGEMNMKVEDNAYGMSRKHALWQKYGTKLLQSGELVSKFVDLV